MSLSHFNTSCCSVSLRRVGFKGNRFYRLCYRVKRTLTNTSKGNAKDRTFSGIAPRCSDSVNLVDDARYQEWDEQITCPVR
jgi:hypothetical protein